VAPNQQNSSQRRGAFFCAGFIALEAIQSVYFGGLFQTADSFLIGSATFGIGCAVCLAAAAILDAGQFAVAWRLRGLLAKAGLATAIGWLTYFMALQLLEPAVTYTVFSGAIPITVALAAQFGVATATRPAGRLSLAGHVLLAGALVFLCAAAIGGFTGFDRGGMLGSVGGVVAVLTSAVAISWALFYCRQMTRLGWDPICNSAFVVCPMWP
jgi:hypothetical protein